MKISWSSLLWGALGLVAGFSLCYFSLVPVVRMPSVVVGTQAVRQHLEWRPQKVLPVFPPKVAGH